jgi:predicted DNA-binding transcriptional regulator AlpA
VSTNQLLLELITQAKRRGLELSSGGRSGVEWINLVKQLGLKLSDNQLPAPYQEALDLNATPQRRRWVRTPEAAAHAGASTSTFEKYRIHGGGPPYCKLGPKLVVYDLDELDKWLEARRRLSTSDPGEEEAE